MTFSFFLVTESSFHASYLVTKWVETFKRASEFKGIIVREDSLPEETLNLRELFHLKQRGQTYLPDELNEQLRVIYPHLSKTERAMVKMFGVPAHSPTSYPGTVFLGRNLNSSLARQWLTHTCTTTELPFLFVFLDQLLDAWWIELTSSRIINAHSAVLPYARGMFAIERVAISQDIEQFNRAAGATVHYIDTGVDTGPIIRSERLVDPFHFDSIWEQKGYAFTVAFDLLIRTAQDMLNNPFTIPVGTSPSRELRGPNFRSRDFTPEACSKAEQGYLEMKKLVAIK